MSENEKIEYIKSKGWHQWYSNTHWVHKDIFKMFEKTGIRYWKSDYTNYQMTLDEAYDLTMTN